MPQDSKRRLAAIMFADVVGYTAMMQQNEQEGLTKVHRFSEVMEAEAQANNGEVLEFRGDGCLAVFDSAVEAMRAAKAIQSQLKESPNVPLRIGIHIGDIVFTKGNIYGDGVNLASRVESMGVPGSILVTERVIHDVKSHPEFEMASLGKFKFKNVEKPMEVFALANEGFTVPRPKEMKGKGKKVSRMPLLFLIPAIIIGLVGAVLIWQQSTNGQANLLSKDIREEKVAVAIFENLTGDDELDVLGYLASEWITIGLQEIDIETVTPEMIRQYKDYIGVLPNNPEGKISFAEVSQANYLISGSYLPKGDSLQLITRLTNTHTGEEVQRFPVIKGLKVEKENLVEEARKRLMGYWAIEKDQYFPKVKPPKYEAYQKYLDCVGGVLGCHLEVLELDSTFILNHIRLMFTDVWMNRDSLFHLSERYVRLNWDECTEYEKNFYTFSKAFWEGDYDAAYIAIKANYEQENRDVFAAVETALFATYHLKRPKRALPIFEKLFDEYDLLRDQFEPPQLRYYPETLISLKRFEEVIQHVNSLPKEDWNQLIEIRWFGAWRYLYIAYLETGQKEKALAYVEDLLKHRNDLGIIRGASTIWSTVFQDTISNPFHDQIRQGLAESTSLKTSKSWEIQNSLEYQYYILGEWEEAEKRFLDLRGTEYEPKGSQFDSTYVGNLTLKIESMIGAIYGRQGKVELAMGQIEKLEKFREKTENNHSPLIRGLISWEQARIHAVLGNREEALNLIRRSIDEGHFFFPTVLSEDIDLANLRGYEPFERLVEGRQ